MVIYKFAPNGILWALPLSAQSGDWSGHYPMANLFRGPRNTCIKFDQDISISTRLVILIIWYIQPCIYKNYAVLCKAWLALQSAPATDYI